MIRINHNILLHGDLDLLENHNLHAPAVLPWEGGGGQQRSGLKHTVMLPYVQVIDARKQTNKETFQIYKKSLGLQCIGNLLQRNVPLEIIHTVVLP